MSALLAPIEAVSALPALIDRATAALTNARTAAEVLEAKEVAGLAYDAAKRAARLATAKGAHDELISTAYRMQADALEIEASAKRRLADEYDAAQERGEVKSNGGARKFTVPDQNTELPSAADIGLSRKDIHEARIIRDAERADPGIVRRTLDDRVARREEPNKTALRNAVIEAAQRGMRPQSAPSNRNPIYRPPSDASKAWQHLYGVCRALSEWSYENAEKALTGREEAGGTQAMNEAAIREAANFLADFVEKMDA